MGTSYCKIRPCKNYFSLVTLDRQIIIVMILIITTENILVNTNIWSKIQLPSEVFRIEFLQDSLARPTSACFDLNSRTMCANLLSFLPLPTLFSLLITLADKEDSNWIDTTLKPTINYNYNNIYNTSITWRSFIGVWVTASLFKYPELFSVFWPILTVLSFG